MTEMGVGRSAKIMRLGRDEELDAAVFLWFKQKREEGIPITGPIVQAKARELDQRLIEVQGDSGHTKEFTASSGWLWHFCQHHSIRQLSLQGEKLSADQPANNIGSSQIFKHSSVKEDTALIKFLTAMRQACITNFCHKSPWLLI